MAYYDANLTTMTCVQWAREQVLANAAALYPDLLKDHPDYSRSGKVDPKDVFQILVIKETSGWMGLLVHGVPRARPTLVQTRPSHHGGAEKVLVRLMDTTAELLGMRYPAELGISSRKGLKTEYGMVNRDFF